MFRGVVNWWRKRQRSIDIAILWPSICQQASSERQARDAFLAHAIDDEAWSNLSLPEIVRMVTELDWPDLRSCLATTAYGGADGA